LPVLQALECPAAAEQACKLTGSNLFLVDSVAGDPEFKQAVKVPDGFPGRALPVPRPGNSRLYIKLRDDPAVVNVAALTAKELPPPPGEITETPSAPSAAVERSPVGAVGDSASGL